MLLALLARRLADRALSRRQLVPLAGVARGTAALALGAGAARRRQLSRSPRQLAWTPGGIALSFGRMLQDGIVKRYLAEHCPDPRFKLCDHRDELPDDADVFFWGESVFDRLGRFKGMNEEMRTIVLESLDAYPLGAARGRGDRDRAAARQGRDRRRRASIPRSGTPTA